MYIQLTKGYAKTRGWWSSKWITDRMWRKNVQPNLGSAPLCVGTDPNRNFPAGFATGGASPIPCAPNYHGPAALSAPESMAIYNYVKSVSAISYMDFHSYSQLWMVSFV
jgi:carboxypeptidase B